MPAYLIELQIEEYPAPVCDRCAVAMRTNKRIDCSGEPHRAERLSYECRLCHMTLRVGRRSPASPAPRSAAS